MIKKIIFTISYVTFFFLFAYITNAKTLSNVTITAIDVRQLPQITAYVSVFDEEKKKLAGLSKKDFQVFQDKTQITNFSIETIQKSDITVSSILVIDRSGSMVGEPLVKARQGACKFVSLMGTNEKTGVISFGDDVKLIADFSKDKNYLQNSIKSINLFGDTTVLYDAIYRGLKEISNQKVSRKALIVLTDGKEESSKHTLKECINIANDKKIRIFSIGLGYSHDPVPLKEMTSKTKGNYYYAGSPDKLVSVYQQIADELHNEYAITFKSPIGIDRKWHDLTIHSNHEGTTVSNTMKFLGDNTQIALTPPIQSTGEAFTKYSPLYLTFLIGIGILIAIIIVLVYVILTNKKKNRN